MKKILVYLLVCGIFIQIHGFNKVNNFTEGNGLFTADVYKELASKEKNILVSPFSAQTVLALTQSGAKDATAEEIRTIVRLPSDDATVKTLFKDLLTSLKSEEYTLHTANKVYIKNELPVKNQFKLVATDTYKAELENIDFLKKEEAAAIVNKWVEEHTQNKIHNLVEPKHLEGNPAMVLVNALYFRGRWMQTFANTSTTKAEFYRTATDVIRVETMHRKRVLSGFFEDSQLDAKFLQLSFEGDDASLVIVLPNEKEGLGQLETQLENVFRPIRLQYHSIDVALPKFRIESKTDFKKILQTLGMSKAFEFSEADFSEMAGKKGDMMIGEVIQKAFIEVNEEGVEAAAATFALPVLGSAYQPEPPKKFIVDHPFIYYLKVKDVILFAGKVTDPTL